jgi:RNA-binding protein with serine-rich domain 1
MQAEVELNPGNKMSKGTAVLEFATAAEAEAAMRHVDGGQIDGQVVQVSYVLVKPRRRRASPGEWSSAHNYIPE